MTKANLFKFGKFDICLQKVLVLLTRDWLLHTFSAGQHIVFVSEWFAPSPVYHILPPIIYLSSSQHKFLTISVTILSLVISCQHCHFLSWAVISFCCFPPVLWVVDTYHVTWKFFSGFFKRGLILFFLKFIFGKFYFSKILSSCLYGCSVIVGLANVRV